MGRDRRLLAISIITLLIIIYILISSYINKQNIISKVLEETEIVRITGITRAKIGKGNFKGGSLANCR